MRRWSIDRPSTRKSPSILLRQVLRDAAFVGGPDVEVSGLSTVAEATEPGQAFVALRGREGDGHDAVATAAGRGAVIAVVERPCPGAGRPQAVVPDTVAAHARLCHALAGDPAEAIEVVGLAGADEAEAVAIRLGAIFAREGARFGSVGLGEWTDGTARLPVGPGPLDPPSLAAMLDAMAARGCLAASVAFPPEALAGAAIDGVAFAAAVVTGVRGAPDDGPGAREARRLAYARLARRVRPGGVVVVDADDPDSEVLGAVNLDAGRVSVGIEAPADLRAEVMLAGPLGARFRLVGMGLDAPVALRSGDLDAVRQALAAAATARAMGVDGATIVAGLESVDERPGRPDRVDAGQPFEVLVDAARTAEELERALDAARPARPGRLICVVGSEGHGDRLDRCRLAEVAEAGADAVLFTSDNPRGEDPRRILDELLAGTRHPGRARAVEDRGEAIAEALAMARPGDVVVLAGKGRRAFQILADRVVPFDDRDVAARRLLAEAASRRSSA